MVGSSMQGISSELFSFYSLILVLVDITIPCFAFFARRLIGLIEESKGTVAYGGDTDEQTRYIQPTLITDVTPDEKLMQVGVANFDI